MFRAQTDDRRQRGVYALVSTSQVTHCSLDTIAILLGRAQLELLNRILDLAER